MDCVIFQQVHHSQVELKVTVGFHPSYGAAVDLLESLCIDLPCTSMGPHEF